MNQRATARSERVWPLRLLQLSPLFAAALLVGTWFAVPPDVSARRMSLETPIPVAASADPQAMLDLQRDPEYEVLSAFQSSIQPNVTQSNGISDNPESAATNDLYLLAENNVATLMKDADTYLFTSTGDYQPYGYPNRSAAFKALDRFESTYNATVLEWVAPQAENPRVVASYVADPGLLTREQRHELETSHTLESVRVALASEFDQSGIRTYGPGTVGGRLHGPTYQSITGTVVSGKRSYECFGVFPASAAELPTPELPDPSSTSDPSSPGFQALVQLAAVRQGGDIFVVGPMDAPGVPIRSGRLGRQAADRLVSLLWPSRLSAIANGSQPVRLTEEQSRLAGGAKWVLFGMASGSPLVNLKPGEPSAMAEQNIVFAALFTVDPRVTALRHAIVTNPWRALQVRIALWLPWVLGGLGALLVAALIASLLAFVAERRLRVDRELELERERVRTAARELVLDRLASLSAHVDRASVDGARRDAEELDSVSRDIDGTVAELRRILGSTAAGGRDDA